MEMSKIVISMDELWKWNGVNAQNGHSKCKYDWMAKISKMFNFAEWLKWSNFWNGLNDLIGKYGSKILLNKLTNMQCQKSTTTLKVNIWAPWYCLKMVQYLKRWNVALFHYNGPKPLKYLWPEKISDKFGV